MLIPSMWVGLAGTVLAVILMAADWQIWEFRYRISRQRQSGLADRMVADSRHIFHVPSASGREMVATLAAQSPYRDVQSVSGFTGRWVDHCSQG